MRWVCWVFSMSLTRAPFFSIDLPHRASSQKPEMPGTVSLGCLSSATWPMPWVILFICLFSNDVKYVSCILWTLTPQQTCYFMQRKKKICQKPPSHWENILAIYIYFCLGDLYGVVLSKRTKISRNVRAFYVSIGLCLLCVYVCTHSRIHWREEVILFYTNQLLKVNWDI